MINYYHLEHLDHGTYLTYRCTPLQLHVHVDGIVQLYCNLEIVHHVKEIEICSIKIYVLSSIFCNYNNTTCTAKDLAQYK